MNNKHTELRTQIEHAKGVIKATQDRISSETQVLKTWEETLDKLEIELLNLDEEEEPTEEEVGIYDKKAEKVQKEYLEEKEETATEYQERAQRDLDDINSFNQD